MIPLFTNNGQIIEQDNTDYSDYIIVAGQSNIDGRNNIVNIPSGYAGSYSNVLNWGGGGLQNLVAGSSLFTNEGVNKYAWDTLVLKDLADHYNKTLKFIKFSAGGTTCGNTDPALNGNNGKLSSWNPVLRGALLDSLLLLINRVKMFERNRNKVARFRMLLWDQKESDADIESFSLNYSNFINNELVGSFVDVIKHIRSAANNSTLPIVFTQQMTTQASPFGLNMVNAQVTYETYDPNAYLLRLNENTARYPLADTYHYNDLGTRNIATDIFDIVVNNNLLNNYFE